MIKPIPLTPELAAASNYTYQDLVDDALKLLAKAGHVTMKEQAEMGQPKPAVSANECLGLATRVVAEAALQIQVFADKAEFEAALKTDKKL
jgi:hypothetical protein